MAKIKEEIFEVELERLILKIHSKGKAIYTKTINGYWFDLGVCPVLGELFFVKRASKIWDSIKSQNNNILEIDSKISIPYTNINRIETKKKSNKIKIKKISEKKHWWSSWTHRYEEVEDGKI